MISRRRIAVLILTHASALALGGAAGALVGFESARAAKVFAGEIAETEWYSAHLFADRLMGDLAQYKMTLLKYLGVLNARRGPNGVILSDHAVSAELVLTETRLALVAEAQAANAESKKYFAQALADCLTAWQNGCSEDRLREIVLRLDRGVSASRQNPQ